MSSPWMIAIANEQRLFFDTTADWASLTFLAMLAFTAAVLVISFWFSLRQQKDSDDPFSKFVQQQRQHLSDLRGPLSSLWDELAPPPFRNNETHDPFADLMFTTEEICQEGDAIHVTHFCFLVHGHRGTSRDLGYVQAAMRRTASHTGGSGSRLVLHSVSCNEKKTDDGVEAGGERVMDEMLDVIRERMECCTQQARNGKLDVTISMLGNSLGGLYSRFALSVLRRKCEESCAQPTDAGSTLYLDGKYAIHLNIFCTTATPHLGVASHTFLPLPRRAEVGVAHAMGQSGKDLFRLNRLLRDMATQPHYLQPLAAFRKRTAYANAYSTDFPVPACTAAFLHSNNTYPHYFMETRETRLSPPPSSDEDDDDELSEDNASAAPTTQTHKEESSKPNCSLVIATLQTPTRADSRLAERCCTKLEQSQSAPDDDDTDSSSELAYMSATLDSLGWKKVFVDMRKEVPRIVVPKSILGQRHDTGSSSGSDNDTASTGSEHSSSAAAFDLPINVLKAERQVVTSKDLVAAVTETGELGVYWPLGHNMMVAFSRSRWSTYMNRAGRPVVDALAREIVYDMLSWDVFREDRGGL